MAGDYGKLIAIEGAKYKLIQRSNTAILHFSGGLNALGAAH
jgi:hypothetical protein